MLEKCLCIAGQLSSVSASVQQHHRGLFQYLCIQTAFCFGLAFLTHKPLSHRITEWVRMEGATVGHWSNISAQAGSSQSTGQKIVFSEGDSTTSA